MNAPQSGLHYRTIYTDDGVNSLRLGDASLKPLKAFLKKDARRFHEEYLARTLVGVQPGDRTVIAFATLVCANILVKQLPEEERISGFRFNSYPAMMLARLAVDKRFQGQGIGTELLDLAISLVVGSIMPIAGCRYLLVDAKESSVRFYERHGFARLGELPDSKRDLTSMYIDLLPVARAVSGADKL